MALVIKQSITLGGGSIVGSISINGGAIRGEGGPVRPRIVLPIKFELNPQPEGTQITVTSFTATLGANQYPSPTNALCRPVTRQLISGFPAASQRYASEYTEEVRLYLTQSEVEDIEALRHTTNTEIFTLYVDVDVVMAALKIVKGTGTEQAPWNSQYGILAELLPFWTTKVQPLQMDIEQSTWVREVLPGLTDLVDVPARRID